MEYKKIKVIDSIMGKGKTSWAIQYINEHPDISFIYCTPFLKELKRIKKECSRVFHEPEYKGGSKLNNFNDLLMEGKDIVVTHSTFSNSNDETLDYLSNGNYCLILDEVLDILVDYKSVCNDELSKSDIKLLISKKLIKVNTYGKVSWIGESYPGSKYSNVERLANNGTLFYLDKSMLVWQFPPQIFRLFKQAFLLTYLFDGSFLKPYFEYHNIEYELASIKQTSEGKYYLVEYTDDKEERSEYSELINILNHESMNDYNASSLSKSWYRKSKKTELKKLKGNLTNYFRNITKAKSKDILWTCPKEYMRDLKGKGYTIVRRLTPEESQFPKQERNDMEGKLQCFIPCNAKATNDYADRSVLAYLLNMYANPYVKRYFTNKNETDGTDIKIDQDYFALSCMLQWIWRSQIRNGKAIDIYIPSKRMRHLLYSWLNGEM